MRKLSEIAFDITEVNMLLFATTTHREKMVDYDDMMRDLIFKGRHLACELDSYVKESEAKPS